MCVHAYVRACVHACVCVCSGVRAYECVHWREGGGGMGVMQVCAGQKVCVRVDVCERESICKSVGMLK